MYLIPYAYRVKSHRNQGTSEEKNYRMCLNPEESSISPFNVHEWFSDDNIFISIDYIYL